jgi:hypothetical protein
VDTGANVKPELMWTATGMYRCLTASLQQCAE